MKHLVLTQFGTPAESVALHDDRDPVPGPRDVLVRMAARCCSPSMNGSRSRLTRFASTRGK